MVCRSRGDGWTTSARVGREGMFSAARAGACMLGADKQSGMTGWVARFDVGLWYQHRPVDVADETVSGHYALCCVWVARRDRCMMQKLVSERARCQRCDGKGVGTRRPRFTDSDTQHAMLVASVRRHKQGLQPANVSSSCRHVQSLRCSGSFKPRNAKASSNRSTSQAAAPLRSATHSDEC